MDRYAELCIADVVASVATNKQPWCMLHTAISGVGGTPQLRYRQVSRRWQTLLDRLHRQATATRLVVLEAYCAVCWHP